VIYLKSLMAGLAALIIAAALVVGVFFVAPLTWEVLTTPAEHPGADWSFVGPYPMWPVVALAIVIFFGTFLWAFRKATKAEAEARKARRRSRRHLTAG
jgi:hypothetical protein